MGKITKKNANPLTRSALKYMSGSKKVRKDCQGLKLVLTLQYLATAGNQRAPL